MKLIRGRRAVRPKVFVLGLDGTPHSYLKAETSAGRLPNLAALFEEGASVPMRSSLPSVSGTAWMTVFTGRDPGGHGIYGFMDCRPDGHAFYFPTFDHVRAPVLWDLLARAGKRSVVLNVPGTYPARAMQGVLVAGFVAPQLERAVHPPALLPRLRALDYRIDLDTQAARETVERLEEDLFATFARRREAVRMLLADEDWDLFVAVVTETDRLYHFLWNGMEDGDPRVLDLFQRFHAELDAFAGWLADALPEGTELLVMSDHGFTSARLDVYTNAWLVERGYLSFDVEEPRGLSAISPRSTVYSLDPGRFYVNRAGARPRGGVPPAEVGAVVERLVADLAELRDPVTGELVYSDLVRREQAYHGPEADRGPDLVLTLKPRYELKGGTRSRQVFRAPAQGLAGMHTSDDSQLYLRGGTIREGHVDLHDIAPTIAELLGVDPAAGRFQGRSLLGARRTGGAA
ncbi:MAG TPA: alkaline phosphatase family protein [Actinomycetes bacterium]|nr:alkaline phosphatase family protein [Actinomycetes bacterium]